MIKAKFQQGVSLIEILITTLVLGIGLLGVAALQVSGISSNQEGFYTSQATFIAEDYASRIRSGRLMTVVPDPDRAPGDTATVIHQRYVSAYDTGGALTCGSAPATMCRSNNGATPASCGQDVMAAFDRWEVCDIAKSTLPDGKVRAVRSTSRLSIVVDWAASRGREDMGSKDIFNTNCQTLGITSDRNCVIVELVP